MKKILLSLMILISVNVFAHHLDAKGWCSLSNGKAVFQTVQFNNNLNVEVQYKPFNASGNSDPWLPATSFNTHASGNTDTLLLIAQGVQNQPIKVRFRYKSINSNNWGSWSNSQNSTASSYSGCGFLPVKFIYFNVEAITGNYYKVVFEVGEAEDVTMFVVTVSNDGVTFRSAAIVTPNGILPNRRYTEYITIK